MVVLVAVMLMVLVLPLVGCKQPEQQVAGATNADETVVDAARADEATGANAAGQPGEQAQAAAEGTAAGTAASNAAEDTGTPNKVEGFAAYVPDMTVKQGEIIAVPVRLTYADNAAGFQMTVKYDPKKLEIGGGEPVTKGSAVPAGSLFMPNAGEPGQVRVACAGSETFDAEKQELFVIHFKAVGGPGTTTIDIDDSDRAATKFGFANEKAKPIKPAPKAVDGTITIQ
jgi:hypothetical protein